MESADSRELGSKEKPRGYCWPSGYCWNWAANGGGLNNCCAFGFWRPGLMMLLFVAEMPVGGNVGLKASSSLVVA